MRSVRYALVLLLFSAAACKKSDPPPAEFPDAGPHLDDPESARLLPPVVHAGYDGVRDFLVPVYTDLSHHVAGSPSWSSGNPSIATIAPAAPPEQYPRRGVWAMITPQAAGETTVSATIGGYTVTSQLIVSAYTAAQVAAGEDRYNASGTGDRRGCASCHLQEDGVDHSPTEMAYHPDDALFLVITEGRYPDLCIDNDGEACTCDTDGCTRESGYVLGTSHEWNLTEAEAEGIVPYLRALPPRGF
jgi:hypothetical protein